MGFESNSVSDKEDFESHSYNHSVEAEDESCSPANDKEFKALGLNKRVKPSQGY